MKFKILLLALTLLSTVGFSQLQIPNIGTGPNTGTGDNLRSAMEKLIANDTFLDDRLDSLIGAGVGESYTAGNGLQLAGTEFRLGGTLIGTVLWDGDNIHDFQFGTGFGTSRVGAFNVVTQNGVTLATPTDAVRLGEVNGAGLTYGGDYSPGFTSRSLIDKGYADSRYFPASGTFPNTQITGVVGGYLDISSEQADATYFLQMGSVPYTSTSAAFELLAYDHLNVGIHLPGLKLQGPSAKFGLFNNSSLDTDEAVIEAVTNNLSESYIKIHNIPTTNPCALPNAGPGTLWVDGGFLKVCP